MGPKIREATHAGTWYSGEEAELRGQLARWLQKCREATPTNCGIANLRAVIAPHAGYSYSGEAAAYAYAAIDPSLYDRVIILGPSHHVYLDNCQVTTATEVETPLGSLKTDSEFISKMRQSGLFPPMSLDTDEREHSIEMHLPYVAQVFREHLKRIKVVTVLVGALSSKEEERYGRYFAEHLRKPSNLFIVSSDFCHWGKRFRYSPYDPAHGEIYEFIEHLDRSGIQLIEQQSPVRFQKYLRETSNTICGRHPIAVLLFAIQTCGDMPLSTTLVKYEQSSSCRSTSESSVSYASLLTSRSTQPED